MDSRLDCAFAALRDAATGNHPLHRLAGQLRDALVVGVVVQHCEPGSLSAGSDEKIWQRYCAMLGLVGQPHLNLQRSINGGVGDGYAWHGAQAVGELVVYVCARRAI